MSALLEDKLPSFQPIILPKDKERSSVDFIFVNPVFIFLRGDSLHKVCPFHILRSN